MHGAGNDYVLVDARELDTDWPDLAKAMCDRHMGVGADGLLLVLPSEAADIRMRMFNPDGAEAEMCGNGIRCLAKYVLERDSVHRENVSLDVETMSGVRSLEPTWRDGSVTRVRVAMGEPELRPERIPVALSGEIGGGPVLNFPLEVGGMNLNLTFVSMGNPHAVAFIEMPVSEFPLQHIGPAVEHHAIFPNKVNFSIVNTKEWNRAAARVWERAAGETLACGTGACAIAVASRLHGFIGDEVDIMLPGGIVTISWDGIGQVYMEGPAEEVFEGDWNV